MNYRFILMIPILLILNGCAGTPADSAGQNSSPTETEARVSIDRAIQDLGNYVKERVKAGKIQAGAKVWFSNVESDSPKLSDYLINGFIEYAINDADDLFTAVDRADSDLITQETDYQLSGAVDDAAAVELGKQLAAQDILTGQLMRIGPVYQLRIRMIDVKTAKNLGQKSIEINDTRKIRLLLAGE